MAYKIKKESAYEPVQLPVYKIKGKFYFRDVRLGEYRNVKDPSNTIPIDDVSNDMLEKPTAEDSKTFGES